LVCRLQDRFGFSHYPADNSLDRFYFLQRGQALARLHHAMLDISFYGCQTFRPRRQLHEFFF
jgi:hypothetical protein